MTQSYNLEQVVIIKSGFVLNCMISDKGPFCQAHITLAGQQPDKLLQVFVYFCTCTILHDCSLQSEACQALDNQCPSIAIMNACMCLRNKYCDMTQQT